MKRMMALSVAVALAVLVDCSSSNVVPVSGTIKLDDAALSGAVVTFRPVDQKTAGLGGSGTTDAAGKYTITSTKGERGLPPGEYVVSVSYRRRPDGSAPDPNVPPMESDAVEKLPPQFSDPHNSKLRATVAKDKPSHDFVVSMKGK